jgi:hypothetical protein
MVFSLAATVPQSTKFAKPSAQMDLVGALLPNAPRRARGTFSTLASQQNVSSSAFGAWCSKALPRFHHLLTLHVNQQRLQAQRFEERSVCDLRPATRCSA